MLFLLLTDEGAFRHFLLKHCVFLLGAFLAPLHELHGEGKAQNPGNEGVLQHLGLLGLQLHAGVLLPDLAVGQFFPGQPQQRLPAFLALGEGGDLFVNDAFRQLILLHPADDAEGFVR